MIVHGASFSSAKVVANWSGQCQCLIAQTGLLSTRRIPVSEISSVSVITGETISQARSGIGGAVIGGILAGPLGFVAGGLLSHGTTISSQHVVGITLADGETFVGECTPLELKRLLGVSARAATARNQSTNFISEEPVEVESQLRRFGRGRDDAPADTPVLKRIVYSEATSKRMDSERENKTDPLNEYQAFIEDLASDEELSDEQIQEARILRKTLKLAKRQIACVHARVFHACLSEAATGDEVSDEQVIELRHVRNCLKQLGWAPGD
ncbi:MAG: hypothetical protein WCH39_14695 [Schlesneria sp.]